MATDSNSTSGPLLYESPEDTQPSSDPPPEDGLRLPIPMPSSTATLPIAPATRMMVISDDLAVNALIEAMLERAGLTIKEVATRMGVVPQTVSQYKYFKKRKPSVQWLGKLAVACGGKLFIEFPAKRLIDK